MARERTLTEPDELTASAAFKARVDASGKRQEALAAEIVVSQGTVWQWANGRLAITAERALEAAAAVGAKPEEISVSWRKIAQHFNSGHEKAAPATSQSTRPTPDMLQDAMGFLDELDAVMGTTPAPRPDPVRLSIALEIVAEGDIVDGKSVVVRIADRLREKGQQNGNEQRKTKGTGAADGSPHGRASKAKSAT